VDEYIHTELAAQQVAGPYTLDECQFVKISRFGVIPKNHQANKWRLIVDLSYPRDHSVNDNIPSHLCSLSYITVDEAIHQILKTGQSTLLVKVDMQ